MPECYQADGYFDENEDYVPACPHCWDEGWYDDRKTKTILPCPFCNPHALPPQDINE